jgi:putative oxidoreductase
MTTIWIIKITIAVLFAFAGTNKVFLSKTKLIDKGMKGLIDLDEKQIKIAGILEVLGATGLILPSVFNYYPVLAAISALCLGLTMIVAGGINHKLKLSIIPNVVIFAICIFIAYYEMK